MSTRAFLVVAAAMTVVAPSASGPAVAQTQRIEGTCTIKGFRPEQVARQPVYAPGAKVASPELAKGLKFPARMMGFDGATQRFQLWLDPKGAKRVEVRRTHVLAEGPGCPSTAAGSEKSIRCFPEMTLGARASNPVYCEQVGPNRK
ncbi:hypothetical protein GVN21_13150 [Caulobacter sp. SLTY]|uniref:hypothetical protein n=1 Tax=Caulobacter sp. SLTY TaxID=2683262 RepID=UPI001411B8E9|nr:hypothetical protein [Caulobacter sp. SLTY]NBB16307.1 hypothetical protein [Caulobacter sp. SLTY]